MHQSRLFINGLTKSKTAAVAALLVACAPFGKASLITITFDPAQLTPPSQTGVAPVAQTPADLLSYWGVTFASSATKDPNVCSDEGPLCFGDMIGTAALGLNFLTDDVLSGSITGSPTLTLNFFAPTTVLGFGVVIGTSSDEVLSVELSGPANAQTDSQTLLLQAINGALLSEAEFTYGGAPITQAVITFSSDASPIFAIDNLTFNSPNTPVPEPKPFVLVGLGSLFLGILPRRAAP